MPLSADDHCGAYLMDAATHPVWNGDEWVELPVAAVSGELVVVPIVTALLYRDTSRLQILLQRRDKSEEAVRGRWELPGGRWRAGERATVALAREVLEETGIAVTAIEIAGELKKYQEHIEFEVVRPMAVVAGVAGSFPSVHLLFACIGDGELRPRAGESADPKWWSVPELLVAVRDHAEDFIWHTRAMLSAVYGD